MNSVEKRAALEKIVRDLDAMLEIVRRGGDEFAFLGYLLESVRHEAHATLDRLNEIQIDDL